MAEPFAYSAQGIPLVNQLLQPITIRGGTHVDPDGNTCNYDQGNDELRDSNNALIQQPANNVAIQVAVAAAGCHAAAPTPAPTAVFALSPAHISRQLIDCSTKEGIEMNKQATKSLHPEDKGFNLEPSEKFVCVRGKAQSQGPQAELDGTPPHDHDQRD